MFKYLQRLGKSLMLPVAVLPAASLLVGIGYYLDPVGWGANSSIAAFLLKTGLTVLDNLPILFAIGVAIGMSKDRDGAVTLAGVVSYLIVTNLLSPGSIESITGAAASVAFAKIQNTFIGMICGLIAAHTYNRFSETELPEVLAFFSGKRLVPILTAFISLIAAGVLFYIWPVVFEALTRLGESIVGLGAIGAGLFGLLNRLLIPVGLHHTINQVFFFDLIGINDIGRFWGPAANAYVGLPAAASSFYHVGMYQAGFFPIMMFGLPGAGLAMALAAKKEKRAEVMSLMIAVGLTAFLTGVTEPIEFSFMFLAPALYLVHAILTALSLIVVALLGTTSGFAFSAGLTDFLLSLSNPNAHHPYYIILIGLIFFALYFVIFYVLIKAFDFKTPGRDDQELEEKIVFDKKATNTYDSKAQIILEGLGGKENLLSVDNCATRLRLDVKDSSKIDKAKIKKSGAIDTVVMGDNYVQIIIGTKVQFVADALKKIIK